MNIFQIEWKAKALGRLYFNGDVGEHVFRRAYNANKRNLFDTLCYMERRVDNVLFRCMFASSVFNARRMASTGQVIVNGTRIWRPGYSLSDGDIIQIHPAAAPGVYGAVNHPMIRLWSFIPAYLEVNHANLSAVFMRAPKFEEIPSPYPKSMIENMSAFYSKRG
jgi:small subunit ribosomal protein S4